MKNIKIPLFLIFTFLLFSTCKKEDGDKSSGDTAEKLATILTVQNGAVKVYTDTLFATHDSGQAVNAMGRWLLNQPDVEKIYLWSYDLADVHFQNGLQSTITFVKEDANGKPVSRGGSGRGSALTRFASFKNQEVSEEKIGNNKVLVLNPFEDEFYDNNYSKKPLFEGGSEKLDVTIINGDAVNYSVLNTLGDYGFIILNTHGLPQGFILRKFIEIPPEDSAKVWTRQALLDALSPHGLPMEKFENGELRLNMYQTLQDFSRGKNQVHFLVTDKLIRNASFSLDKAVVFGNHCYSGYTASGPSTYNMAEAWKSKGAISYYGYGYNDGTSDLVLCPFADRMEDSLIINLVKKGDSTGIAHLENNSIIQEDAEMGQFLGAELPILYSRADRVLVFQPVILGRTDHLKFKHYFEDNYSYGNCGDTITDIRDGQQYPTVCIGEQVWMATNLNWAGEGVCYDNNASNCNTYGRLYSITELTSLATSTDSTVVKGLCPDGWHVPSKAEYEELIAFCGGETQAADKLRSASGWPSAHSNAVNFDLKPAGHYTTSATTTLFRWVGQDAKLWTSSQDLSGLYFALGAYHPDLSFGTFSATGQEWYFSCRCVKD